MIYFLIYLFLEIFISVEISSTIGPFWTFVEVVLSALVGLLLLINFRYTLSENLRAFVEGEITAESFQKQNLAAFIGAFLLIIPGFLTDIVGLLLQFSVFSSFVVRRIGAKSVNKNKGSFDDFNEKECDVIDVEVIYRDSNSRK